MGFGDYPVEYNPKVHGPYDPARYYGKPDTPFGQVKLGELGQWLTRRNKTPNAVIAATSRAYWRWLHKYVHPKRTGLTPFMHISCASMIFFYVINYKRMKAERRYEYH
uniref:Putative atp synthase subunit f mitochondrial n=1 Tax=Panstrongylus lignarius TaxID=156445 RepID=A0A224Y2P4_9HEMI